MPRSWMISDNSRTDSLGFHEAQLYHCGYLVPTQARLASTALWLHSFNYFLIWVQSSVIFCLYRCKSQKQTTLLLNTGPFLPSFLFLSLLQTVKTGSKQVADAWIRTLNSEYESDCAITTAQTYFFVIVALVGYLNFICTEMCIFLLFPIPQICK